MNDDMFEFDIDAQLEQAEAKAEKKASESGTSLAFFSAFASACSSCASISNSNMSSFIVILPMNDDMFEFDIDAQLEQAEAKAEKKASEVPDDLSLRNPLRRSDRPALRWPFSLLSLQPAQVARRYQIGRSCCWW
jgi:hypothetical protein